MRNLVVCSVLLACAASAWAGPVSFPPDHPYVSLQGLTVDDSDDGVVVVAGNKYHEPGKRFTMVNGQTIKTAREMSLLVGAAAASNGKLELVSEAKAASAKLEEPPVPPKEWARALAFSDSPDGVVIEYSLRPEEVGGIFRKFNGEPVMSAVDLKAKLDRFVAAPPRSWSTSIETVGEKVSPEQLRADAIIQSIPAIASPPPLDSRRFLFLARAVENEPPRPSAADTDKFASSWGPLAKLAGKIFVGDVFKDTCEKAHQGNSCYVMMWWEKPGTVLTRAWFADRGFLVAADTVVPTGRPGLFTVHRWGPEGRYDTEFKPAGTHFLRVTKSSVAEKGLKLDYRELAKVAGMTSDDDRAYHLSTVSSGRYQLLQSYSRTKALENSKGLRDSIQRSILAAREEERQRQRSGSMSAVYGALNSLGQAIDQQNQVQQQAFEQQLRNQSAASGGGGSGGAIIVKDTTAEEARRRAEEQAHWDALRERERQQAAANKAANEAYNRQQEAEMANRKDCWGRPISTSGSSSSNSSSGGSRGPAKVCPQ